MKASFDCYIVAAVFAVAALPHHTIAQSVGIDANGTSGQGIMRPRGINECLIVAPLHVVESATPIHAVGDGGARAELNLLKPYSDADLAILDSRTAPVSECTRWRLPPNLQAMLADPSSVAVLRSREADGSLSFVPVWIENVSSNHVQITPRESARHLLSGMSGSQLLVNGQFAGMLLSVDPTDGRGRVVRSDVVDRLVGGFFTAPRNEDPDFSSPALGTPINDVNLWIRTSESVVLGDENTSFGVATWDGTSRWIRVQMNDDQPWMSAGTRFPFRDSRGECHIIYMRTEDPNPNRDYDERHGFVVLCKRKQEQQNEHGTLRRRTGDAPSRL
jgi:hypothetical protein